MGKTDPSLPPTPTRDRLVEAAADLFRRQGLAATGVKEVLVAAHAQFSSLYHYFPNGKDQLAAEAIISAGLRYQHLVEAVWDASDDPAESVIAVFDGAAAVLEATDYSDACPIGTVALEVASTNEPLRVATNQVFTSWIDSLYGRLLGAGIPTERARPIAEALIALLEGGFMLSRAAKSTEAMSAVRDAAIATLTSALGSSSP